MKIRKGIFAPETRNMFSKACFYLILALLISSCTNQNIQLIDLQTCNLSNPEGIDFPILSWKIKSTQQGIAQKAWEVEIASTQGLLTDNNADVWKSGRQKSQRQFEIKPKGVNFSEATAYYWRVRIWDNSGKKSIWSEPAYFSIGLNSEQSWKAKWITYSEDKESALPYFRKVFNPNKEGVEPVKAMVYLCGLGCSELYLNGQKVDSTRFLDPAQSNYEQYAFYTALDITKQLKEGENCVGVMLGNGWFAQDAAWNGHPFDYGSPMLRLQLDIIYSDGTRNTLGTDESWEWKEGPVLKTNIYLGELFDAGKEIKDWCRAENTDSDWKKAVLAQENIPPRLVPQLIHPIRTKQVINAVDMWQGPSGNWIFDFGVNVAGIPQLSIQQPAGRHLTIRMAEEKKADGSLDFSTLGWIHHGKVFSNEYICNGEGVEQWSPRFTYHGFRYAELSGMKGKPDLSALKLVVVHSDLPLSGSFECSDSQINKLHELAVHTVLSNLHGVPTDCPNREKCGWLGDCHAYVKMTNLNMQMNNFWTKYLEDIRSGASAYEQKTLFHERHNSVFYFTEKPTGLPYMIAPGKRLCGVASPDWGTALVQLPWSLYEYYGTEEVLKDFYPNMKQWTNYVSSLASDTARTNKYGAKTKHIVYQGLGDWCPPGGNKSIDTPIEFSSTAFHYLDVSIMEKTARILGKDADADFFATEKELIAAEMLSIFYNKKEKTFGSQTAGVMALDLGLVPDGDEEAVADAVVRNMNEKHNGFMHCGIFGIGRIGSMLARNGNAEAAWDMFTKKGEDSFAYMWNSADATTLWEILPVNKESQMVAAKASHNHPMQAGYDVCFYEDVAGIRPDESGYGFRVIRFEPLFTEYLDWAKASVESPFGTIVSSWQMEDGQLSWHIIIPPNAKGIVTLQKGKMVVVNGKKLNEKKYKLISNEGETSQYHFPSGSFDIQAN
jgi:alpha-L-rhamnosidase